MCSRLALGIVLAAAPAAAQTFVVDAANGPGTNFTDLPAAVAAAPSGAVLHVRPGTYTPFTIANKSLKVIGHRSATGAFPNLVGNLFARGLAIGPLSANQSVTVSGLDAKDLQTQIPPFLFNVTDCAGPVVLEDMALSFQVPLHMTIRNCANVHCARVTLGAFVITGSPPTQPPLTVLGSSVELHRLATTGYRQTTTFLTASDGMWINQQSRVVLVDSGVSGGVGLASGANGGSGIFVGGGSTLHAFGTGSISGGSGSFIGTFGAGGDGLVLSSGSTARIRGVSLNGGFGTPSGQTFRKDAGSTIDYDPSGIGPSAIVTGTVQPGNTVQYTLNARPGSPAALLIGLTTQFQMPSYLKLGALGVVPIFSVPGGNVPAAGKLEIPSLVPAGWPDNTVVEAQFVLLDQTTAELLVSNVCTATSRY
jgi:hypothetical protein